MANVTIANSDPRQADDSARVSILIDGQEQLFVEEYSIDNDVLNVGDPFRLRVPNIDGRVANRYRVGARCSILMADPSVSGGADIATIAGRVVTLEYNSDPSGGSTLMIGGADLGWHLANSCAPMWVRLNGMKFSTLVSRLVDPSWGIAAVEYGNTLNRRLRQGRYDAEVAVQAKARKEAVNAALRDAEARAAAAGETSLNLGATGVQNYIQQLSSFGSFIPPLQIEPGQMVADLFVEFARREGWLMNVSADGVLQFFVPNDGSNGQAQYSIRYHKSTSGNRKHTNVKRARVSYNLDGVYSRVICVGTSVMPPEFVTPEIDPNANRFRGTFDETDLGPVQNPVPFKRVFSFADGDQFQKAMADRRARWRFNRGRFDAMQAEYTVRGHSQDGIMWVPDTVVDVLDEVHGLKGKYYLSAVRYNRTRGEGTTTDLTIHEVGWLGA